MNRELLKEKREEIIKIASKHGAYNVRVFGSVARGETFIKLAQLQILDDDLALRLKESGKMRNLLVHLYEIIEPPFVSSAIKETLRDYP